jgi:hypothetical protein
MQTNIARAAHLAEGQTCRLRRQITKGPINRILAAVTQFGHDKRIINSPKGPAPDNLAGL